MLFAIKELNIMLLFCITLCVCILNVCMYVTAQQLRVIILMLNFTPENSNPSNYTHRVQPLGITIGCECAK